MQRSLFAALLAILPNAFCQIVQIVAAGENGQLNFTPDTLSVPVGSQVEFQFYPRNHSVASSSFSSPCQPDGKFFSGYMPVSNGTGSEVFVITITDANPIWFYCSQNIYTHCQSGMVGVINPPASGPQNLTAYRAAAAKTTGGSSGDLPQPAGGVVEPLSAAPTSSSVAVATATVTNKSCPSSGMRKRSRQGDI